VDDLRVGERVRVVPAHVCPVVNLADDVTVLDEAGGVADTWRVAARGKVR
jgi:D-serine deaminase-like pyridoxal phosphate-dependent protein